MTRHGQLIWHVERELILKVVAVTPTRQQAAMVLGISTRSLQMKLAEYIELGYAVPPQLGPSKDTHRFQSE